MMSHIESSEFHIIPMYNHPLAGTSVGSTTSATHLYSVSKEITQAYEESEINLNKIFEGGFPITEVWTEDGDEGCVEDIPFP